ncbi:MAG: hypothetical protein AB7G47_19655 [Mycolicibacterium sp.]|uniref:hypothetical protein n=1 Tax=Mycolicibacterium sp. TaxID=2320850 RepID=UPI003D10EC3E
MTHYAISTHTGQHSGFGDSVKRGAGWGLGRDLEHALCHSLPVSVVLLLAIAAVAYFCWRWSRTRD